MQEYNLEKSQWEVAEDNVEAKEAQDVRKEVEEEEEERRTPVPESRNYKELED